MASYLRRYILNKEQRLIIENEDGQVIFHGHPLDVPVKKTAVVEKSIEVFGDDDPCIIHKSYVIKEFAEELLSIIEKQPDKSVLYKDIKEQAAFLDLEDGARLTLEG